MRKYILFYFIFWLSFSCIAQEKLRLEQVIQLAQENSPTALQATNRKQNRYWAYRNFLANYSPQLVFSGVLPNFNRSIDRVTQPDGRDLFVPRSLMNTNLRLDLSQAIALTGGEIFIASQLSRIDIFGNNAGITYLANPLQIGLRQPVFRFNRFKWERLIEPLVYEESQKRFNEDLERVALQATEVFFQLLVAQASFKIAQKNLNSTDTIYRIAEGRFNLGKIAESELLQIQLNRMRAEQQVSQARLDIESNLLRLKVFLGNKTNLNLNNIELEEPSRVPDIQIDEQLAIEQAKNNRERFVNFKRQKLEAQRDVAQATGENGLNVDVIGSLGFTQSNPVLLNSYRNPQDQQNFAINFSIPILDWGRQKARIQTTKSNAELINSVVYQDEINFEQEVYLRVKQFKILKERFQIAQKSDEIAQRRYLIAENRYLIAKISFTELNIALQEKDQARQAYLQAMRDYWSGYREIRLLTVYDFEKNTKIGYEK